MILALLLSALVLAAPGGLAEAWPAAPRLPVVALAWGLALGLPRAVSPRPPQSSRPGAPGPLSPALGLALALPALAAAWALDGTGGWRPLALAGVLCALLAWAGVPRPPRVARRVAASWAGLLVGPWALVQLARWGGVGPPAALGVLAEASPFAWLDGLGEEGGPGLPWLLGVHLVLCGGLRGPAAEEPAGGEGELA